MKTKTLNIVLLILIGGCFRSAVEVGQAKDLAIELYEHKEIIEIDDCTRSHKFINGIRISMIDDTLKSNESQDLKKPIFYKEVLNEHGISEDDFEFFRKRLGETGLRHYYRKNNYSVFITGGMLGDIEGILVTHSKDPLPKDGLKLNEHYYIWIVAEMQEDVFRIRG